MQVQIVILILKVGEVPFHKGVIKRVMIQGFMLEISFLLLVVILHN